MPHRFAAIPAALPASAPFIGPDELERDRGAAFAARLGANENGFGPSPMALEAMARAAIEVWKYGDRTALSLREAIAEDARVPLDCVVLGEGIDGLLGLACRLFLNPGDAAVTSLGAYPTFNYHVSGFGGRLKTTPYRDDTEDAQALMEAARAGGAKLIYLANPDNPMASWTEGAEIARRLDALPDGAILLHDEAYAEFEPRARLPVAPDDPRAIRFRTFSKAHGLAGLRVGYALAAPQIAAGFHRIRNQFGVGNLAQAAALAALRDRAHLARVLAQVTAAKARLAQIAAQNGLNALPSAANFVAIDCGEDGAFARRTLDSLAARGVFARMPGVAPQNRCIRVSAGPDAELDLFAAALPQALEAARA